MQPTKLLPRAVQKPQGWVSMAHPLRRYLAQGAWELCSRLAARARIRLTQQLSAPAAKPCARRLGLSRRLAANGSGLREATRPSSQTSRKVLGA